MKTTDEQIMTNSTVCKMFVYKMKINIVHRIVSCIVNVDVNKNLSYMQTLAVTVLLSSFQPAVQYGWWWL